MKIRVAKSEIQFYINNLKNQGFSPISVEKTQNSIRIVFKSQIGEYKTLCYTTNSWLSLE